MYTCVWRHNQLECDIGRKKLRVKDTGEERVWEKEKNSEPLSPQVVLSTRQNTSSLVSTCSYKFKYKWGWIKGDESSKKRQNTRRTQSVKSMMRASITVWMKTATLFIWVKPYCATSPSNETATYTVYLCNKERHVKDLMPLILTGKCNLLMSLKTIIN